MGLSVVVEFEGIWENNSQGDPAWKLGFLDYFQVSVAFQTPNFEKKKPFDLEHTTDKWEKTNFDSSKKRSGVPGLKGHLEGKIHVMTFFWRLSLMESHPLPFVL